MFILTNFILGQMTNHMTTGKALITKVTGIKSYSNTIDLLVYATIEYISE
jgi:hypothetical protein